MILFSWCQCISWDKSWLNGMQMERHCGWRIIALTLIGQGLGTTLQFMKQFDLKCHFYGCHFMIICSHTCISSNQVYGNSGKHTKLISQKWYYDTVKSKKKHNIVHIYGAYRKEIIVDHHPTLEYAEQCVVIYVYWTGITHTEQELCAVISWNACFGIDPAFI